MLYGEITLQNSTAVCAVVTKHAKLDSICVSVTTCV